MKKFLLVFLLVLCSVSLSFADSVDTGLDWLSESEIRSTVSVDRISASDSTGFKSVMLSLIGDYETVVTDYTYQSGGSGYLSHSINVERDWSWIMSCAMFMLVVFCVFRLVGGFLCR